MCKRVSLCLQVRGKVLSDWLPNSVMVPQLLFFFLYLFFVFVFCFLGICWGFFVLLLL